MTCNAILKENCFNYSGLDNKKMLNKLSPTNNSLRLTPYSRNPKLTSPLYCKENLHNFTKLSNIPQPPRCTYFDTSTSSLNTENNYNLSDKLSPTSTSDMSKLYTSQNSLICFESPPDYLCQTESSINTQNSHNDINYQYLFRDSAQISYPTQIELKKCPDLLFSVDKNILLNNLLKTENADEISLEETWCECSSKKKNTNDNSTNNNFQNISKHSNINDNMSSNSNKDKFSNSSYSNSASLKYHMRETVMNWMHEVCMEENCEEETFYLSCDYLDRTVVTGELPINKTNLQKIAATCMLLASKYLQAVPIMPYMLSEYTDHSVKENELLECELPLLQNLNWCISSVTPHAFLNSLIEHLNINPVDRDRLRKHASTFIDLSITIAKSTQRASVVACSSLLASISGLHLLQDIQTLVSYMSKLIDCEEKKLSDSCKSLEDFLQLATSSENLPSCSETTSPKQLVISSAPLTISKTPVNIFKNFSFFTPTHQKIIVSNENWTPPDVIDINWF